LPSGPAGGGADGSSRRRNADPPARRPPWAIIIAIAVVVVLVAVGLIWFVNRDTSEPDPLPSDPAVTSTEEPSPTEEITPSEEPTEAPPPPPLFCTTLETLRGPMEADAAEARALLEQNDIIGSQVPLAHLADLTSELLQAEPPDNLREALTNLETSLRDVVRAIGPPVDYAGLQNAQQLDPDGVMASIAGQAEDYCGGT
jgi:hypothetical protein